MAGYIPELSGYSGQGAFRYWCQKVLPLVYDDSLSYYELLNKIVVYLNNTIEDVAKAEGNIDSLLTAYTQLQNYVNDYFDNLDVQEEINNKLDEMATDGSLSNLIEPFIPALVTSWLTENVIIPEGGAVTLDPTLTSAVQAAQAKATGDAINNTFSYRGILTVDSNLTTLTTLGWWGVSVSVMQHFVGVSKGGIFVNYVTPSGTVYQQKFITSGGRTFTRYSNSGDFNANLDATLSKSGVGADAKATGDAINNTFSYRGNLTVDSNLTTLTTLGWWGVSASVMQNFVGVNQAGIFVNYVTPSGTVYQQEFITSGDRTFTRYSNSGTFTANLDATLSISGVPADAKATGDAINNTFSYRGILTVDSNLTTLTTLGWWGVSVSVMQHFVGVSKGGIFVNYVTPSGTVYQQKFITSSGIEYTRYSNQGDFVNSCFRCIGVLTTDTDLTDLTELGWWGVSAAVMQNFVGVAEAGIFKNYVTTAGAIYYQEFRTSLGKTFSRYTTNAQFINNDNSVNIKTINDFFAPMFDRTGAPFKITLIGDSITHGVGGTGFAQNGDTIILSYKRNPDGYCWANLFKDYIENNYNATVLNNGITGATSWWYDTYKTQLIPSDTDLVILTAGTNQRVASERLGYTRAEQIHSCYTQLKSVINYCRNLNIPVLLCSSIPATTANEDLTEGGQPLYASHVYDFNGVLQKLASEYNMEYFNLYDAAYYYVKDHNLSLDTLLPDTLHPGDEMYRIMFYLYLRGFNLAPSYVDVQLPE